MKYLPFHLNLPLPRAISNLMYPSTNSNGWTQAALFLSMKIPSTCSVSNVQVIFSLGSKHGPVMLTTVPPNMLPLSGANTNGKLAPSEK